MKLRDKIVVVCGATASGKSGYALELASQINGIIINADSMQVYRELPILTAQPSLSDQRLCVHRLYGIVSCAEHFSVSQWIELARTQVEEAWQKGATPILVGGTGMYLASFINGLAYVPSVPANIQMQVAQQTGELSAEALYRQVEQCDPDVAMRIKVGDRQRAIRALEVFAATSVPLSVWQSQTASYYARERFYLIHIAPPRAQVYTQIDARFLSMLKHGAIEEVKELLHALPQARYPKVLGLVEIIAFLNGTLNYDAMIQKSQQYTRNYAKRQLTWFRNQMQYDMVAV